MSCIYAVEVAEDRLSYVGFAVENLDQYTVFKSFNSQYPVGTEVTATQTDVLGLHEIELVEDNLERFYVVEPDVIFKHVANLVDRPEEKLLQVVENLAEMGENYFKVGSIHPFHAEDMSVYEAKRYTVKYREGFYRWVGGHPESRTWIMRRTDGTGDNFQVSKDHVTESNGGSISMSSGEIHISGNLTLRSVNVNSWVVQIETGDDNWTNFNNVFLDREKAETDRSNFIESTRQLYKDHFVRNGFGEAKAREMANLCDVPRTRVHHYS